MIKTSLNKFLKFMKVIFESLEELLNILKSVFGKGIKVTFKNLRNHDKVIFKLTIYECFLKHYFVLVIIFENDFKKIGCIQIPTLCLIIIFQNNFKKLVFENQYRKLVFNIL